MAAGSGCTGTCASAATGSGRALPGTRKRGLDALDQVANFHLSNGASIDRLNFPGDLSRQGQKRAAGLMVNYRYRLKDIESNHEAYHGTGEIAQSRAISVLLKPIISV